MSTQQTAREKRLALETLQLTKRRTQSWLQFQERKAIETLLQIVCHEAIINENPPKAYIAEKYAAHIKEVAAELARLGAADFYVLAYMYDKTGKAGVPAKFESSSLIARAGKLLGKTERNVTIEYRLTLVFALFQTYATSGLLDAEIPV